VIGSPAQAFRFRCAPACRSYWPAAPGFRSMASSLPSVCQVPPVVIIIEKSQKSLPEASKMAILASVVIRHQRAVQQPCGVGLASAHLRIARAADARTRFAIESRPLGRAGCSTICLETMNPDPEVGLMRSSGIVAFSRKTSPSTRQPGQQFQLRSYRGPISTIQPTDQPRATGAGREEG
jgi:hypothetical protein